MQEAGWVVMCRANGSCGAAGAGGGSVLALARVAYREAYRDGRIQIRALLLERR